MSKKRIGLFVLFVFAVLIASMYFVSAQSIAEDLNSLIDEGVKIIEPIAKYILGETPSGEWLFAKVLFLLIILAIVWTALERVDFFSEKTWVLALVSIAVSVLATRFLTTEGLIQTIILPYSTLAIALTAGLPFIIYFLLVNVGLKEQPPILRRIAWIFFGVIFIGLWITRRENLGDGEYIYPVTALAALVMILLDGTVHRFFMKLKIERAGIQGTEEAISSVLEKKNKLNELLRDGIITPAVKKRREKQYNKQLAALHR